MTGPPDGRRHGWAVSAAALVAAAPGLGNGFVYDDLPIILHNPILHRLSDAPAIWTSGYWPAGLLYRPVAVQLFALEWAAGSGSPLVFHAVNLVFAMAVAFAFWRLARILLPPLPALLVSLLFAVHPVHVEVVANAIGQTELLATLGALVVVERYVTWRLAAELTAPRRALLAGVTLLAILSKETGAVIPLLLLAAEPTMLRASLGPGWRARDAAPAILLQLVALAAAALLRIAALGPTPAAGPAVALRDLAPAERAIGMLAIVPEWLRLLLWPAHLQAEYGPPALAVTGAISAGHVAGLMLLAGLLALMIATRRRAPAAALGIAWTGLALLPVSNLLTATGVIVAERTLFLPSAGTLLAIGAGLTALPLASQAGVRRAVVAVSLVLAAAGAARSMARQRVWSSSDVFFESLLRDAPTTYRAQLVASVYYTTAGRLGEAERTARRGLELYRGDPQLFEQLGQLLRRDGRCAEALPILDEAVRRFPSQTVARSRLIECLLVTGDTAAALQRAEHAVATGHPEFEQTLRRLRPAP